MRSISIAALALVAATAAACNDNDPTALARVHEVVLVPGDTVVEHPDSFRYRVLLLDAEGDPIDDERPMTFEATNQAVINVSSRGYVRTETGGTTQVRARVGGATGTAFLTVTNSELAVSPRPVN